MARYIDADELQFEGKSLKDDTNELIAMNKVCYVGRKQGKTIQMLKEMFKQMIDNAPTADVVPRSEVEKAKQEVAREIFEEFDKLIITLEIGDNEKASVLDYNKYTELEKKYIGEKK